jgi:serine O-acetyltransferase
MTDSSHDNGNGSMHEPEIPSLKEAVRGDLLEMARRKECRFPSVVGAIDIFSIPGTWAVILFRLASTAHHKGLRPLSRFLFFVNSVVFGAEMHPGAIVQPGLVVPHPAGMGFSSGLRIGKRVLLLRNTAMGGAGNPKRPGQPTLGDDVMVMDSATVLGPVHIGDRTIIGAGALVSDDVPSDMFVIGVRKSSEMRPLSEMGLGELEEAKLGYGAAGRRTGVLTGVSANGSSNGHAPTTS